MKVIVDLADDLVRRIDKLERNRSAFIRVAIALRLQAIEREKLEQGLKEGYIANAELSIKVASSKVS